GRDGHAHFDRLAIEEGRSELPLTHGRAGGALHFGARRRTGAEFLHQSVGSDSRREDDAALGLRAAGHLRVFRLDVANLSRGPDVSPDGYRAARPRLERRLWSGRHLHVGASIAPAGDVDGLDYRAYLQREVAVNVLL